MLEMEKVSYYYRPGVYAVNDLSLKVAAGEFLAVAGRNGSGKTTLTRLIMALLKPAAGKIMLDGRDVTGCTTTDMARHIGYVFQNPDRQIFRDTVAAEAAYGPEQLGFSPGETAAAVEAALEAVELTALAQSYPRSLSKGQKQRVAIASALALRPRMLILDEPTSGQDAREKARLMELFARLNSQGMAIVLVTHDMDVIFRYARRVAVMSGGSKAFDGSPAELFSGKGDLRRWGLREPVVARLVRELKDCGIHDINTPAALVRAVVGRRNGHA